MSAIIIPSAAVVATIDSQSSAASPWRIHTSENPAIS
jgi:hypothetical protein